LLSLFASIALCLLIGASDGVLAQPGRRPSSDAGSSVNELESKAEQAFKDYLKELADLANGYEEKGHIEEATSTWKKILKLEPEAEKVKDKIEELENAVFEANQKGFEVDTAKGWISTGLIARKGEPIRFEATGSYKVVFNKDIGASGLSSEDVMRDMARGVDCGALTGIVVPVPTPGRNRSDKPGKPFQIGEKGEIAPDSDGMLFLKVNAPTGAKCIGDLRVKISGNISPASR